MFGTLVYNSRLGEKAYAEYSLAEEHGVRVVACALGGSVKLYRLEWEDSLLGLRNMAVYDLIEAMQEFQKLADSQLPVWLDQAIERQEKAGTVKVGADETKSPLTAARAARRLARKERKAAKAAQASAEAPQDVAQAAPEEVAEVVQEPLVQVTQAAPKRRGRPVAVKAARAMGQQASKLGK
jgi:hypothetical protein